MKHHLFYIMVACTVIGFIFSTVLLISFIGQKKTIEQYEITCESIQAENESLWERLISFPMTEKEESVYTQNKSILFQVYPFGSSADRVAGFFQMAHRLGDIANPVILSAQKEKFYNETTSTNGSIVKNEELWLHIVTEDKCDYYVKLIQYDVYAVYKDRPFSGTLVYGVVE